MNGHAKKRSGYWRVVLELGEQSGRRCPVCTTVQHIRRKHGTEYERERGTMYWSDDSAPDTCPKCGGELEEVTARRQEMLPEKYTAKKAADKALHEAIRDRESGDYVPPSDLTLAHYLEREWLPSLAGEELAPGTIRLYTTHVRQRIVPLLGDVPLQKLTSRHVKDLRTYMVEHKGVRGGLPSAQTRRQTLIVLHKALSAAVRDGLIRRNVAHGVERPRIPKKVMPTWTAEQLRAFLDSTKGSRLCPLWRFLSQTGLRRGEALGLMLDALDLDAGKVRIVRQRRQNGGYAAEEGPLKQDSRRSITIDAATVEALRAQLQQQLDDATEWGDAWQATGHVFTREDGSPWHPDRVTKLFGQAVKAAGLPKIRLHELRGTWATLALQARVHPKVVQERLGHKTIKQTMDTYSHVMPEMQESAAEIVASLVDSAGAGS